MSIQGENLKTLRPAMDVMCGIDSAKYKIKEIVHFVKEGSPTPYWYGESDGTVDDYKGGYHIDKFCKKVPLMDFAGGGFYNDGNAIPIAKNTDTFRKGYQYGIPAETVDVQSMRVAVRCYSQTEANCPMTVFIYDSKGKVYRNNRTLADPQTYTNWPINRNSFPGFPADERIYIGYISFGYAWIFQKDKILDCNVYLRGVETKLDHPELQMSEIEVQAHASIQYTSFPKVSEGARLFYSAGYPDDMSYVRTFYLNDKIRQDSHGVISYTGYDATKFLSNEYYGDTGGAARNSILFYYVDMILQSADNAIRSGTNDDDYDIEWTNTIGYASETARHYYYIPEGTVRERIAEIVNLLRTPNGAYLNTGCYVDYVDAGYPIFRAAKTEIDGSMYESLNINLGTPNLIITADQIANREKEVERPFGKLTVNGYQMLIDSNEQIDSRATSKDTYFFLEADKPVISWVPSPEITSGTTNVYYEELGAKKAKAEVWVANAAQKTLIKPLKEHSAYQSPYEAEGIGDDTITFPDVYASMLCQQSAGGSLYTSVLKACIPHIAERSNELYTFTYRGNPKMQPRDVITVDGELMTVESLTLEHTDGGLISNITARKGRV